MSMVGELNKELEALNKKYDIEISAIISRSGVPIAWNIPDDAQIETFSTLTATILGASEVVYSSLGKSPPARIIIESNNGLLMSTSIGSKALIA
ncbi:MAG: roadblock/LC7 domain-containing protein, partial [Thermoplasmata archaeon]|nr:roadblock/LC7 domain-containing protein [Thermoplasmata archaeon]